MFVRNSLYNLGQYFNVPLKIVNREYIIPLKQYILKNI